MWQVQPPPPNYWTSSRPTKETSPTFKNFRIHFPPTQQRMEVSGLTWKTADIFSAPTTRCLACICVPPGLTRLAMTRFHFYLSELTAGLFRQGAEMFVRSQDLSAHPAEIDLISTGKRLWANNKWLISSSVFLCCSKRPVWAASRAEQHPETSSFWLTVG